MPRSRHSRRVERRERYYGSLSGRASYLLAAAKDRAKKSGREFSLTKDWLDEKLKQGKCEVTRLCFDFAPRNDAVRRNPFAPSIDRKDNTLGYTPENCQVVLTAINIARNELAEDQFEKIMRAYLNSKEKRQCA